MPEIIIIESDIEATVISVVADIIILNPEDIKGITWEEIQELKSRLDSSKSPTRWAWGTLIMMLSANVQFFKKDILIKIIWIDKIGLI